MDDYTARLKTVIAGLIHQNDKLATENGQLKTQLAQAAQAVRRMQIDGNYSGRFENQEKQNLLQRLAAPATFTPRQGRDRAGIEGSLVATPLVAKPGVSLKTDSEVMVRAEGEEDWTENE